MDGGDPSPQNPLFTEEEILAQTVAEKCPLLRRPHETEEDRDDFTCIGHGWHGFYLSGCNTFPTRPEDIEAYPSCSYTFTWTDDDEPGD